MDPISPPLHVAIIINNRPGTEFWHDIKQSFISSFNVVCADAKLVFFDPVEKAILPDPAKFHLVILSGGKADASASDPWIIREMGYVQEAVKSASGAKLMGICWGHQLIHRALGGNVGPVSDGPVAGLVDVCLTDAGKAFFYPNNTQNTYRASEFHVREVKRPAPGFVQLAKNNECFVSESNRIITFQAHPEIDQAFARKILIDKDATFTKCLSETELELEVAKCDGHIDGLDLLKIVLDWVRY